MKQLIAFSILLCLVFLNVPRSIVHDCDHAEHTSIVLKDKENDSTSKSTLLNYVEDDCFFCEFDLGFFEVPEIQVFSVRPHVFVGFEETTTSDLTPGDFVFYSHRGPPIA